VLSSLTGIEAALLPEPDFESSAPANSGAGASWTSIMNLMRESVQAALTLVMSAPFRPLVSASSPPDGQLTRWRKILSSPLAKNIPLRFLPKSAA
jgi:hypothetical protein